MPVPNNHTFAHGNDVDPNFVCPYSKYFIITSVPAIVFVSGQVGNVITNRNASRQEFERLLVSMFCKTALLSLTGNIPKLVKHTNRRLPGMAYSINSDFKNSIDA